MRKYKDKYRGRTAFILGSGPSIANLDLSLIRHELIFTVNATTLLQEKFDLKTEFFCTSDTRFLTSEHRDLATTRVHPQSKRLVRDVLRPYDDPALSGQTHYIATLGKNGFSKDITRGFYFWCTSISIPIQMAWHLGVSKIVLL